MILHFTIYIGHQAPLNHQLPILALIFYDRACSLGGDVQPDITQTHQLQ